MKAISDRHSLILIALALANNLGFPIVFILFSRYDPIDMANALLWYFLPAAVLILPCTMFALWSIRMVPMYCLSTFLSYLLLAVVSLCGNLLAGFIAGMMLYIILCCLTGIIGVYDRKHLDWYYNGCCPSCGYDMAGLETHTCPECGRDTTIKPRWVW